MPAPKTALGLAFYDRLNDPEDFVQTLEWRTEAFVDYAATLLVRLGFAAGAGLVNVESGADQVFERLLAHASYTLSEKLEAGFKGGVVHRPPAVGRENDHHRLPPRAVERRGRRPPAPPGAARHALRDRR